MIGATASSHGKGGLPRNMVAPVAKPKQPDGLQEGGLDAKMGCFC